jgi:hypothetical protein
VVAPKGRPSRRDYSLAKSSYRFRSKLAYAQTSPRDKDLAQFSTSLLQWLKGKTLGLQWADLGKHELTARPATWHKMNGLFIITLGRESSASTTQKLTA